MPSASVRTSTVPTSTVPTSTVPTSTVPTSTVRTSTVPISADDVGDLFGEYAVTRDSEIRNRIVEAYLPIADRCARRYVHRGEPMADLVQVSRMALVRAVERFDPGRGIRFEAFALPTILGEIRHHFRDNCWMVSVPRSAKELRSQVFTTSDLMSQQLGRPPSAEEVADALDLSVDRVAATLETNRHFRATSWESLTEPGSRTPTEAAPQPSNDGPEDHLERAEVTRIVGQLDERLQKILVWRFYEECTQREIGNRLGIGQVQVSRLLSRALRQLRELMDEDQIDEHQINGEQIEVVAAKAA